MKINYLNKEVLEEYLKNIVLNIKKIYKIKVSGSYIVNIYQNNYFGLIIEFIHKDSLDFFPDLIDLKLNLYKNSDIYLKLNDYFLIDKYESIYYSNNNYYINISTLIESDRLLLSEFCDYTYGTKLDNIKNKLVLVSSKKY